MASIQSKILAQYLITVLTQPFSLDDKIINTTLYVGIALYDKHNIDAHTLLKHANAASHLAKEQDKELAFFDKQSEKMALAHLDMYAQLLIAIKEKQFELLYQYQYNDR